MQKVRTIAPVMLVACLLLSVSAAQADLLGLTVEHYPRLFSDDVTVTYDQDGGPGGKGLLTATGYSWDLYEYEGDTTHPILDNDSAFTLTTVIEPDTGGEISGTLNVTGDTYGSLETLFNSANLVGFGFGGDDLFEFLFVQQGDGLPDEGDYIGVIMYANLTEFDEDNPPVFNAGDFVNPGNGQSNTFYLPEPASATLLVLAGLGILRRRR